MGRCDEGSKLNITQPVASNLPISPQKGREGTIPVMVPKHGHSLSPCAGCWCSPCMLQHPQAPSSLAEGWGDALLRSGGDCFGCSFAPGERMV